VNQIFMLTFTIKFHENICYRKINLTMSPASVAGTDIDADVRNFYSARSRVQIHLFVSAIRVVVVVVVVYCCLLRSCKDVSEVGGQYGL
jgi:hypothetical protein